MSGPGTEDSCDLRELQKQESPENDSDAGSWRQEISARLNRYNSRRKPRPPRYPSLRLPFDQNTDQSNYNGHPSGAAKPTLLPPAVAAAASVIRGSNDALALDQFAEQADGERPVGETSLAALTGAEAASAFSFEAQPTAKIIEFPRSWSPPVRPANELAEPVITSPRILEVPEFVPPPPALGGITIEPAGRTEDERRPGIDFPLQGASVRRRIFAAAMDWILVAAGGFVFGFIFWKMTAFRPLRLQLIEMAGGLGALLWGSYQYLLIVHSGTTPGLRLARLQLSRFDGRAANRRLRRWRVFASFLSALALGMGYTWVFLDEDALCWHDRITHTFLSCKSNTGS